MRYPLTTDALSLPHDVRSLLPRKEFSAVPPWKSLGLCLRVTNKGESGFGKASDRAKAKDNARKGFRWECGGVPSQQKGES